MYWGVFTRIIIPPSHRKVCTNLTIFSSFFCAYFYRKFSQLSNIVKKCTRKPGFYARFFDFDNLCHINYSASNRLSNSSLVIFSFSRRSWAQRSNTSRFSMIMDFAFASALIVGRCFNKTIHPYEVVIV